MKIGLNYADPIGMFSGPEILFKEFEFSLFDLPLAMKRRYTHRLSLTAGIHMDVFVADPVQLNVEGGRTGFKIDLCIVRRIHLQKNADMMPCGYGPPGYSGRILIDDSFLWSLHVKRFGRKDVSF